MNIKISIICPACEKDMELKPFYNDHNPTVFTIVPCTCGINYKDYIKNSKAAKKEASRRANLPVEPVFGDHLRSTR